MGMALGCVKYRVCCTFHTSSLIIGPTKRPSYQRGSMEGTTNSILNTTQCHQNELHRNQFALRAKSTGFHSVIAPRWKSISIQSNIVRHLRDIPRDTHVAKIADYDDTALGTGTLTVHA